MGYIHRRVALERWNQKRKSEPGLETLGNPERIYLEKQPWGLAHAQFSPSRIRSTARWWDCRRDVFRFGVPQLSAPHQRDQEFGRVFRQTDVSLFENRPILMERAGWLPEPARDASGLSAVLVHSRPHGG